MSPHILDGNCQIVAFRRSLCRLSPAIRQAFGTSKCQDPIRRPSLEEGLNNWSGARSAAGTSMIHCWVATAVHSPIADLVMDVEEET